MQCRDLIFRVFVSSTFSNLVAERNALQESLLPELRQYCPQTGGKVPGDRPAVGRLRCIRFCGHSDCLGQGDLCLGLIAHFLPHHLTAQESDAQAVNMTKLSGKHVLGTSC